MKKRLFQIGIFNLLVVVGFIIIGCSLISDDTNTFTVTFNSNGGTNFTQKIIVVTDGETVTLPIPTRSGYQFGGWFTDNNTFKNSFTSSTIITADITVYAKWTKDTGTTNIGDNGPGGGTIFFAEGGQFMESSGELGATNWNQAIVTAQNYRGGGFTDWHLPTRSELDLMYKNLKQKNLGNFSSEEYWTSEEYNYNYAWYQDFFTSYSGGYQNYGSKSSLYNVRAVRSYEASQEPETGTRLKITNQSSHDLIDVSYGSAEFENIEIGKDVTKSVSADNLVPIYFYLQIAGSLVQFKTNDLITCEEDIVTTQAFTNSLAVTAIASNETGSLSSFFVSTNDEARLSGLQFTAGTLSPQFNASINSYDLRIEAGPTLINVTPVSMDPNVSSISVNNIPLASGVMSQDILLGTTNTVTIVVIAQDGITTTTYTINLKVVNTWEKLYGLSGQRYGIFRAIRNGSGGIYAGGYTGNDTAALFNFNQNGNLLNTFEFASEELTNGPWSLGTAYNDFSSVYAGQYNESYYITHTPSPTSSPTAIETSLEYNDEFVYMYPKGMDGNIVAGNAEYLAATNDEFFTYGVFVSWHYDDGTLWGSSVLSLIHPEITDESYTVRGMTVLVNGDVLLYGACTKSGVEVAFAAAIDVSADDTDSWTQRWVNYYQLSPSNDSAFRGHFWDSFGNIVLVGYTGNNGFVMKIPGSAESAAAAKPSSSWPKVISENGLLSTGSELIDGTGYLFVGGFHGNGSNGETDIWVVKTDTNASTITWEKYFGGAGNDYADAVIETSDGFIIAGSTNSPTIAGQTKTGTEDIYLIKMNKDGTMD
ncbi:MAG: InlB B-repeat-containing protein [Treponema sp.]|nr:InlB B-repeat-containing protein [Treponema sp.]